MSEADISKANDELAAKAYTAIEHELQERGILFTSLEVGNFNNLNIDIVILYDEPKFKFGYHKSYYSIGKLRAKLKGLNGFKKETIEDFAKLIVDHFEFSKRPPKKAAESKSPRL